MDLTNFGSSRERKTATCSPSGGKVVVDPRAGRTGDMLVQVFIEVPKKVNAEQERLLRELAELDHEAVLPHRKSFLRNLKNFFDPESDSSES